MEVVSDGEKNLIGIYYQSHQMKENFQMYPDFVMIDATYKLNNLRMPLFILLIVDGNGLSEIVALWVVTDESKETLRQMVQLFKKHNPNHNQIKCVMADKDLTERAIISDEFDNAHILICLFHTLRSIKREVSCEKLKITSDQRNLALEILQKLAYSRSLSEYDTHYQELTKTNLHAVIKYFNENWDNIKDQWVEGLKNEHFNLLTRTNNRLESINQKIKSVVTRNCDINSFWMDLMKCITTLNVERDHQAAKILLKTPIAMDTFGEIKSYADHLTPYAFI